MYRRVFELLVEYEETELLPHQAHSKNRSGYGT